MIYDFFFVFQMFLQSNEDSLYETDTIIDSDVCGRSRSPLRKAHDRMLTMPPPLPKDKSSLKKHFTPEQLCKEPRKFRQTPGHSSWNHTLSPPDDDESNFRTPSTCSLDQRGFNQAPNDNACLDELRRKVEASFGYSLDTHEGSVLLQLVIYRQNVKILSELAFLKRQSSVKNDNQPREMIKPELLGLPLNSVDDFK